jgi:endonuclease/exonuclease/phosphatase family metal-dependent hydrolase
MRFRVTIVVVLLAITLSLVGVGVYNSNFKVEGSNEEIEEVDYSFKVMSFNVRTISLGLNDNPNDSIVLRAPLILEQIASENPDLIGCQEWTATHEKNVAKPLSEKYGYYAISRDGTPFGEMGAIFYKKERFELIESSTFWLSDTPSEVSLGWDGGCHRICSTVLLKDLKSGKTIEFNNTHLDNKGVEARENGTKLITAQVVESEYPSIVVGDFNYNTKNYNYTYCTERMDDARLLSEGAVTTVTYNGWDTSALNVGGYPIDHIMLKKDTFNVSGYKVLNYQIDNLFASDHFAIVAVVEVK